MRAAWPIRRLGDVLETVTRKVAVDPIREYRLLGVRLDGMGPFHRETRIGTEISATKLYEVKRGDFIYSRLFAWRGAFGLISDELDGHFVSNEFPTFTAIDDQVDPRFLSYWFRLPSVLRSVEANCAGSTPLTRNRFKEEFFLKLEVSLPPIDEQRRILARIEELAAKLNEALRLRSETAEETESLGRSATDSVYHRLSTEVGTIALSDGCESITDGDHITPAFAESGVKFIFVGNVSTGRLHFDRTKFVRRDYFASLSPTRIPKRGDILYSAVGATLGVPAEVDTDESFCFQRHVAILKPDRVRVVPRFLWHMLRSATVFRRAWTATTGSAQPTIPLRAIRALPIPMPPLNEQHHIVAELDALQAKTGAVKALQAETATELDAMLPAILDKAFKGDL